MGGGGSSGEVRYPEYMETHHGVRLEQCEEDAQITRNNDPYVSASAYDPTAHLDKMTTATSDFESVIDAQGFDAAADWISAFNAALAAIPSGSSLSTYIATEVAAFTDEHDAERNDVILPRFKAGMTDVNAVMTSAFVIGQSIIEAYAARDVTRFDSDLTQKAFLQEERLKVERARLATTAADSSLSYVGIEIEAERALMHYKIDVERMNIESRRTREETDLEIDAADAIWNMETYQYGANIMASIGGASMTPATSRPTKSQTTLGGAAAGAGVGAMVGGPGGPFTSATGAMLGAVIGGIGGFLSG